MNHCQICDQESGDKYCAKCGQMIEVENTTMVSLLKDYADHVFSVQKSILLSLIAYVKNPFVLVNAYFVGYRNYWSSPAKFMFYALAVAALNLAYIDDTLLGLSISVNVQAQILFWIIFLPLLFSCSYFSFIRYTKNAAHSLISITYSATSSFMLITILVGILKAVGIEFDYLEPYFAFLMLTFFWNSRGIRGGKKWSFHLAQVFVQLIVFALICLSFVALFNIVDPENLNLTFG